MLERTCEHEQYRQQQQVQTQRTDTYRNTTLVRKHFSSEDFILCADQECWETPFQSFDLHFKCLGVTLIMSNIFSYFKSSKMLLRQVIKLPKKF